MSWPAGSGQKLKGTHDLTRNRMLVFDCRIARASARSSRTTPSPIRLAGGRAGARRLSRLRHGLLPRRPRPRCLWRAQQFRRASFSMRWPPAAAAPQPAEPRPIEPTEPRSRDSSSGQANMDPNHRDRVASCACAAASSAAHEARKWAPARSCRSTAHPVLARERGLSMGVARDIIIPNHGVLRVGDTDRGRDGQDYRHPQLAPEILRRVRLEDPMKSSSPARAGGSRRASPGVPSRHRRRSHRGRGGSCSSTC